jgi:hypothetical protein
MFAGFLIPRRTPFNSFYKENQKSPEADVRYLGRFRYWLPENLARRIRLSDQVRLPDQCRLLFCSPINTTINGDKRNCSELVLL